MSVETQIEIDPAELQTVEQIGIGDSGNHIQTQWTSGYTTEYVQEDNDVRIKYYDDEYDLIRESTVTDCDVVNTAAEEANTVDDFVEHDMEEETGSVGFNEDEI